MSTYRNPLSAIYNTLTRRVRSGQEIHTGLWLDKYIANQEREDTESRRTLIEEASALLIPQAYNAFYARWEKVLKDYGAQTRKAIVKGRMIIGLGDESVLETSIALHRTYGIPYIPGSALKGLAASYVRQRLGETWQPGSTAFKVVFGDTDDAGYITFFDALYIPGTGFKGKALYPDVITVHHEKYYQGTSTADAPTDRDNPTPIPFLSTTGSYLIALAAPDLQKGHEWITSTFTILEQALKTLGIGAKTSSGYGRMELESGPDKPALQADLDDADVQKAHGYKKEIAAIPPKNISGQIQSYFQKWGNLKSDQARRIVAHAIIEKVRQANLERTMEGKPWYSVLQRYITDK